MKKMSNKRHALLISLSFIICHLSLSPVAAQGVTATYQFGIGQTNLLDTYLSQEKFSGLGLSFLETREHSTDQSRWSTHTQHQLSLSQAKDRSELRKELEGDYSLFIGRYYEWWLFERKLRLQAGGLLNGNLGVIYNTSNSNNPAQARLSLGLMPSAIATMPFTLWKVKFKVRYQADLPLAGVMFSPNYGQSYYEIFSLGDYDHNIVPTTFLSAPNFRQQLSVDCSISRLLTLRLGYLGDYQQADVNNLKSHVYHHRVMIGFVRKFSIINHAL